MIYFYYLFFFAVDWSWSSWSYHEPIQGSYSQHFNCKLPITPWAKCFYVIVTSLTSFSEEHGARTDRHEHLFDPPHNDSEWNLRLFRRRKVSFNFHFGIKHNYMTCEYTFLSVKVGERVSLYDALIYFKVFVTFQTVCDWVNQCRTARERCVLTHSSHQP